MICFRFSIALICGAVFSCTTPCKDGEYICIYGRIEDQAQTSVCLELVENGYYECMDTSTIADDGSFQFKYVRQSPVYLAINIGGADRVPFVAGDRDVFIILKHPMQGRRIVVTCVPEPTDFFPVQWLVNKVLSLLRL